MDAPDLTRLLQAWRAGEPDAVDQLLSLVYDELRALAGGYLKGERVGHILQPTALVHEAYLRLLGSAPPAWRDRVHFFAVAARQMRRILVDHARAHATEKRGGEAPRVTLDEDRVGEHHEQAFEVLLLDEALRDLAAHDERKARVIELRYFAGMTLEEAAAALDLSISTVNNEARFARAWLRRWLEQRDSATPTLRP